MTLPAVVGLCAFFVAIVSVALGNFYASEMIDQINCKREPDRQISPVWFTPAKTLRIYGEYRQLYPDGRLNVYLYVAGATCVVAMSVCWLSIQVLLR